jgi:hypothetical protein
VCPHDKNSTSHGFTRLRDLKLRRLRELGIRNGIKLKPRARLHFLPTASCDDHSAHLSHDTSLAHHTSLAPLAHTSTHTPPIVHKRLQHKILFIIFAFSLSFCLKAHIPWLPMTQRECVSSSYSCSTLVLGCPRHDSEATPEKSQPVKFSIATLHLCRRSKVMIQLHGRGWDPL